MKDLVERYLAAVERGLPKAQSKDIVRELREALSSKIEAREEALGRPATDDEVAEELKSFGHPLLVASRYSGVDHLIGPSLFPWFWPAQRTVFGVVSAIILALGVVRAATTGSLTGEMIQAVVNILEAGVWTFGIVTLVFIALQQTNTDIRIARVWDPKSLPQDAIRKPKPLFDSVFALAFDAIFILWWVRIVEFPSRMSAEGGAVDLDLSDAWAPFFTPILVLALVTAAVHLADIFHPGWSRLRSGVSIAGHAAAIAIVIMLVRSDLLVSGTFVDGASSANDPIGVVSVLLKYALAAWAAGWAIGLAVELWRQVRATRPMASQPRVAA